MNVVRVEGHGEAFSVMRNGEPTLVENPSFEFFEGFEELRASGLIERRKMTVNALEYEMWVRREA